MEPNGNEAEALFREEERSAATAVKQPFETSIALSSPAQMIAMRRMTTMTRSSASLVDLLLQQWVLRQFFLIENLKLTESDALKRKMG